MGDAAEGARQARVLFCNACGGPLDALAWDASALCRHCETRLRVHLNGRTYVVEGQLGRGDACDVFRARWAMRLGELVVLKVNRTEPDVDLLRSGVHTLERLHRFHEASEAGLAARLPKPIAFGPLRITGQPTFERWAAAFEWPAGFQHTLLEVAKVHPNGVDGRIGTWILRRLLEVLGLMHRHGYVHGAVLPPHVLVHPRDHGAMLVGFGLISRMGTRLPAVPRDYAGTYRSREASAMLDLSQAAHTVSAVVSGGFPEALGELVQRMKDGTAGNDAWGLAEQIKQLAKQVYGPPSYNPLPMPGW